MEETSKQFTLKIKKLIIINFMTENNIENKQINPEIRII